MPCLLAVVPISCCQKVIGSKSVQRMKTPPSTTSLESSAPLVYPRAFCKVWKGPLTTSLASWSVLTATMSLRVRTRESKIHLRFMDRLAEMLYRASWAQHRSAAPKNLTAAEVQALQPQDPDLTCSIDNKLLREAVTTPCCSTPFCHECISDYLRANASLCPECESKIKNVTLLKPDLERRKRVSEYVDEMVRSSKENAPEGEESTEQQEAGKGSDSGKPDETVCDKS